MLIQNFKDWCNFQLHVFLPTVGKYTMVRHLISICLFNFKVMLNGKSPNLPLQPLPHPSNQEYDCITTKRPGTESA